MFDMGLCASSVGTMLPIQRAHFAFVAATQRAIAVVRMHDRRGHQSRYRSGSYSLTPFGSGSSIRHRRQDFPISSSRRISTTDRRPCPRLIPKPTPNPRLLLLLLRHHNRLHTVIRQLQMRATSQALVSLQGLAEDTQTDRAHEPNIHDPSMAETRRAKIDPLAFPGQNQPPPRALVREIRHHEVLQDACFLGRGRRNVDAARRVGGLLQKHRVAGEFEDVDCDVGALAGEDAVHDGDVLAC